MSKLIEAVEAKLAAEGTSVTAAAQSVGLSLPSFRAVLKGKSNPNARGLKKYAKLLGVSNEEVAALVGGESKKAKGAKRGPKPGRKAKGAKRGPKPGRKAGGSVAGVIAMLSQAEALLGDDLAVAVHNLGKAQRSTLEMIVRSLG